MGFALFSSSHPSTSQSLHDLSYYLSPHSVTKCFPSIRPLQYPFSFQETELSIDSILTLVLLLIPLVFLRERRSLREAIERERSILSLSKYPSPITHQLSWKESQKHTQSNLHFLSNIFIPSPLRGVSKSTL